MLGAVTGRLRMVGAGGGVGLVVALVVSLSALGGTGASWTGSAAVRAPSLTSGSVSAALTGFTGLTTTFSSDALATTSYIDVLNPGSSHAGIVISTSLSADSSYALAAATAFEMWQVDDASKCTASADPAAAPVIFRYAGNWAQGASLGGDMVPNESDVLCIRSRTSPASLASSASFTVTFKYTLTDYGGSHWSSTTTASATENVVADPAARSAYSDAVLADGALHYWRLGESSGPVLYDWAGTDDAYAGTGLTRGAGGALLHDSNKATSFSGDATGTAGTRTLTTGPQTFSVEAWFRTTSTAGGKIVGFGTGTTPNGSGYYDRHLYLDGAGHVMFGVWSGYEARIATPAGGYNDGRWHQAVGVLGPSGEQLFVDGAMVGTVPSVTSAQVYDGYWHIGGDSPWDGTNADLQGDIDEVAVYGTALSSDRIEHHWALGSGSPEARFTSSSTGPTATFDGTSSSDTDGTIASEVWDFGDGSAAGTGTGPTHTYSRTGTYTVALTVTDDSGRTGTVSRPVVITDVAPPTAPGAPALTANLGTSVALTWPAATDDFGVTGYDVYRDGTLAGSSSTLSYIDTGLTTGTTYRYTVRAKDAAGNVSTDSSPLLVSTAASDTFQVQSTASLLCAEASGTSDYSPLVQEPCASPPTPQQSFRFVSSGGGGFHVVPASSSAIGWDVFENSTSPGAAVILYGLHDGDNQRWAPVLQSDGTYTFVVRHSGQCLATDGSTTAGAGMQQTTCAAGDPAQRFTLVPVQP